jgi:hypothetical protein
MEKPRRLIDTGAPTFFAHEIYSAEIVGNNVRIVFVDHLTVDREPAAETVLTLIRPLDSCLKLTLRDLLTSQMAGRQEDTRLALH